MKLRFSGHRVLILGGSCELAGKLAERLVVEELRPILACRDERGARRVLSSLSAIPGRFDTARIDFADRRTISSLFGGIEGGPDFLVDFAQGHMETLIGASDPELVQRYFAENVSFRAEMLRTACRVMLRKKRGRMVFISSAAASRPNAGQGFYAASKLASEALYRNVGLELGSRGITSVILRPGYVDAGRGRKYMRSHAESFIGRMPLGKALSCEEVADAVTFLLSDNARFFNATAITMDGGLTAGK